MLGVRNVLCIVGIDLRSRFDGDVIMGRLDLANTVD